MMLPSITINFKQWCSHGQVDKEKEKRKKGKERKEETSGKKIGRDSRPIPFHVKNLIYVVDA